MPVITSDLLNRWLHAIVTVPDGRVLACRTHYGKPAGTTAWAATIGVSSFGQKEHSHVLKRKLFNKFGITSTKANLLLSHKPPKSAYDYKSHFPIEVFHMHLEDTVTLSLNSKVEIKVLPFELIMKDLENGKWAQETTEILNIVDALCFKRFKTWNIT